MVRADGRVESAGGDDLSGLSAQIVSAHRVKDRIAMCSQDTDAGRGWLRLRVGQPGVLLLRSLGPPAVGEWRWRWFDVGQLTYVRVAGLNTRI